MKRTSLTLLLLAAMAFTSQALTPATVSTDSTGNLPAAQEQKQAQMPTEFFGCQLGYTGREQAKSQLESRKLTAIDYDGALVVQNASLGGFRFSAAMLEFDELGVFSRITYLNSGLTRQEAIDFSEALHTVLDSRYITVKSVIDGLDCYFASVGGITCQLATKANGDSYYVSLSYEPGTAELK